MSVQAASTYVQLTTTGKIGVNHNSSWVYLSDAILATGVNYKIDVTDDADGNVKVWLNGVLMYSDTLAFVDTSPVTRGQLNNSLTTNDIEFMCFPTALGGTAVAATDRVVCPQKNDTFSHVNDLLFIIRNPTLPTTGSVDITMRVSGDDELHLNLNSSGDIAIKRNTTTLLSVLGVASGGDDIYVYLTGQDSTAEGEVWLSSSSSAEGSFTNVGTFEGTSGALSSDGVGTFVCDSFEVWPFYVEMPFTREAA